MKLHRIELFSYRLGYLQPISWSDTVEDAACYVLLRLTDADGFTGLAEATCKPTWSGYTVQSMVQTVREIFVPLLRAADLSQPQALTARLRQIPQQAQGRGLVESALWMLGAARAPAAAPASQGLRVPVSCTLTRQEPARMAAQAEQLRGVLGVRSFKLKGGQGRAIDLSGVHAVRAAVGDARLYVDANSAYAAHELAGYSVELAEAGVSVLEDPCPFSPLGFAQAAARSALPLLVDLAAHDSDCAAFFASHGASIVSAKPGRYGFVEALRVATAARQAGRGVCMGLFGESDLGTLLNLQLWAQLPFANAALPAELTFYLALRERVMREPLPIQNGELRLPPLVPALAQIDFNGMQQHACP